MYNVQFFIQDLIIFNRTNIVAVPAIYIKKNKYYITMHYLNNDIILMDVS